MVAHSRENHIFNWSWPERTLKIRSALSCCPQPKLPVVGITSGQPAPRFAASAGLNPPGRLVPFAPFSCFRLYQYDIIKSSASFLVSAGHAPTKSQFTPRSIICQVLFYTKTSLRLDKAVSVPIPSPKLDLKNDF